MKIQYYADPFDHWVIDDFMPQYVASALSDDFVDFDHKDWYVYDNPLERKKSLNNWWNFPRTTYSFIEYLNSPAFIGWLSIQTGQTKLFADPGLHGAGWHIHGSGGKLNVHLDYSIHPKMDLERKYNLIYYLSEDWDPQWGGGLELWKGTSRKANEHVKTVDCKFNRVILFDTTQNSWHGFPNKLQCPEDKYRKSIAMYYLTLPSASADPDRKRAYYVPSDDQIGDPTITNFIEKRSK